MENFTPRAQQVLALAREEAGRLNHSFVGTEHLLLGLVKLGYGVAGNVLHRMGLDLDTARKEVEKQVGKGPDEKSVGYLPYTPRVKKVLAMAAKEAKALNHTYVGTEAVLLGLLHDKDGVAARLLECLEVDLEACRREVLRELDPNGSAAELNTEPLQMLERAPVQEQELDSVDTGKRYDVYCSEGNDGMVIYRNVTFKGRRRLLSTREHDIGSEFLEVEQSSGQTVYLSALSVCKFCEHGTQIDGEALAPE